MKLIRKVIAIFDSTSNFLAFLAAVLMALMMLAVSTQVVMRYFLGRAIPGVIEYTTVGLIYMTFLGAAWVLKREGHVKMDLLLNRLNPRTQALTNTITSIIGAIMFLGITVYSIRVTLDHYVRGTYEPSVVDIPSALVLAIIPIGSFFLFIEFLRRTDGYWRISTE